MSERLKFLHFNNYEMNRKPSISNRQAKKNQSRTLAAMAPLSDTVLTSATEYLSAGPENRVSVVLEVGVEKVSLLDNYNKQIGRTLSKNKIKPVVLKIVGLTVNDIYTFIHLEEFEGVKMSLRLNRKTGFTTVIGTMNK